MSLTLCRKRSRRSRYFAFSLVRKPWACGSVCWACSGGTDAAASAMTRAAIPKTRISIPPIENAACRSTRTQRSAQRLPLQLILGLFVDQYVDEGEPLRLVVRFRQQFAITVVIKPRVSL